MTCFPTHKSHSIPPSPSPPTHTHTITISPAHKDKCTLTLSGSLLRVLLGLYSLQLNFKHSSQYISHSCHHACGVYIPVCIRGVELRARCDRQRLTVEKDVFVFTVMRAHTHRHTHAHRQAVTPLQNRALISPQEIYERSGHLYIISKAPGSHTLTSLKTRLNERH